MVTVAATNASRDPLLLSNGHTELNVAGGQLKQTPKLWGCGGGVGGGTGAGIFDAPETPAGQSVAFHYLLKGYRLLPGAYNLRVSGHAGAPFDALLKLLVRPGADAELRQRYARYLKDAESPQPETARLAREAIAEMAPPFLEPTIAAFADRSDSVYLAVEGLGQIPTPQSRADLIRLYDRYDDPQLRASIVEKLAGLATPAELPFFTRILPGPASPLDDRVRVFAILGIGRLGGDDAVHALESAPPSANPEVRWAVANALGNTRSAAAVPALIAMYADEQARPSVCSALATLTHRQWCSAVRTVADTEAQWRQWWQDHASRITLYGNDQCVQPGALPPLVP